MSDYRVVYAIRDELPLVVVVKVGSKTEIYRRIRESDLDFLRKSVGG